MHHSVLFCNANDSLCLQRSCRVDVLDNRTYLEHETYELGAVQTKLLHVYSRQCSLIGVLEFLIHNFIDMFAYTIIDLSERCSVIFTYTEQNTSAYELGPVHQRVGLK